MAWNVVVYVGTIVLAFILYYIHAVTVEKYNKFVFYRWSIVMHEEGTSVFFTYFCIVLFVGLYIIYHSYPNDVVRFVLPVMAIVWFLLLQFHWCIRLGLALLRHPKK